MHPGQRTARHVVYGFPLQPEGLKASLGELCRTQHDIAICLFIQP